EALERSERVRHVYVHAGGKVEALGTNVWAAPRGDGRGGGGGGSISGLLLSGGEGAPLVTVETVCVVDVRENKPEEATAASSAAMAAEFATDGSDFEIELPASAGGGSGSGGVEARAPAFATSMLPTESGSAGGHGGGSRRRDGNGKARPKNRRRAD
ncbi:unnamed protein product, partial [Phaeothamnion confervicola]